MDSGGYIQGIKRALHDAREEALPWRTQLCNGPSSTMQRPSGLWNQEGGQGSASKCQQVLGNVNSAQTGTVQHCVCASDR